MASRSSVDSDGAAGAFSIACGPSGCACACAREVEPVAERIRQAWNQVASRLSSVLLDRETTGGL